MSRPDRWWLSEGYCLLVPGEKPDATKRHYSWHLKEKIPHCDMSRAENRAYNKELRERQKAESNESDYLLLFPHIITGVMDEDEILDDKEWRKEFINGLSSKDLTTMAETAAVIRIS